MDRTCHLHRNSGCKAFTPCLYCTVLYCVVRSDLFSWYGSRNTSESADGACMYSACIDAFQGRDRWFKLDVFDLGVRQIS